MKRKSKEIKENNVLGLFLLKSTLWKLLLPKKKKPQKGIFHCQYIATRDRPGTRKVLHKLLSLPKKNLKQVFLARINTLEIVITRKKNLKKVFSLSIFYNNTRTSWNPKITTQTFAIPKNKFKKIFPIMNI